jgi:hypothetical protein
MHSSEMKVPGGVRNRQAIYVLPHSIPPYSSETCKRDLTTVPEISLYNMFEKAP